MRLIVGALLLACAGAIALRDVIASLGSSALGALMPQGGPGDPRPQPHRLDPALAAAAAVMIAPPYGTPLSLQIDPRRLRAIMDRGESQYRSAATDSEQLDGARLIAIAAALGFGPARRLAVQDYPRARLMRSAVSAPDLVRYGLDGFATDANEPEQALRNLAAYFVGRNELQTFSTHLIEAVRDDARLHAEKRLAPLLTSLTTIDGACATLARTIAAGRAGDGTGCPPDLMRSVLAHVRKFGAVEYDADARRRALWALERIGLTAQSGEPPRSTPAVRVVPGSAPVVSSPN